MAELTGGCAAGQEVFSRESRVSTSCVNIGPTERWLTLAAAAGLTVAGLWRRTRLGFLAALGGGYLAYRANTGHCPLYQSLDFPAAPETVLHMKSQVTILCRREEAYRFWKDFESLPLFMQHLAEVTVTGPGRSHWVANAPGGISLAWDAEIVRDRENELIAWRSLPGSKVDTAGEVLFLDAPGNRGTEIHTRVEYHPPGGLLGETLARWFHPLTSQQMKEDMRRFKRLLETGEIPTTKGQPSGNAPATRRPKLEQTMRQPAMIDEPASTSEDNVVEASAESFPASDAPGWTKTAVGNPTGQAVERRSVQP